MQKIIDWLKKNWAATVTITKNIFEFLDASALASVSGYAVYAGLHGQGLWYKALLGAGTLMALQAGVLLIRHFNKQGA